MPLSISVVIPYYNGAGFIHEALASVRAQTLAPREIIVVDDGSTRDAADILDREARNCIVVRLPRNRGQAVARNVGIVRATGDWVAFLDCDDLWAPEKLERQAAVVEANPDCRAVHGGLRSCWPDGRERVTRKSDVTLDDFMIFPCPIVLSTVMMQRQALVECGLFDPSLRCCEDLELFLRFCSAGGRFCAVPDPLVVRRVQPASVSRSLSAFWGDASRIYRDFLPLFGDERRGRETLREVHTDMALRAVYARDFRLLWRMLRRAARRDVAMPLVMSRVVSRVIRNRLQR